MVDNAKVTEKRREGGQGKLIVGFMIKITDNEISA